MSGAIYICRHGQTEWNAAGRMQGEGDAPLTALGQEQARNLGGALKSLGVADILCSPLGRARASAEIAADIAGFRTDFDARLMEMRFGQCSGCTREEIEQAHPGLLARRETNRWAIRWPGGECYSDVFQRTAAVAHAYAGAAARGQTVVSLAHETVNKCLLAHLLGLDPATLMRIKHYNRHLFRVQGGRCAHADTGGTPLVWTDGLVFADATVPAV